MRVPTGRSRVPNVLVHPVASFLVFQPPGPGAMRYLRTRVRFVGRKKEIAFPVDESGGRIPPWMPPLDRLAPALARS